MNEAEIIENKLKLHNICEKLARAEGFMLGLRFANKDMEVELHEMRCGIVTARDNAIDFYKALMEGKP